MTTKRFAGPTGRLSADDGGADGVPVLFLHSLAGRATHWTPQLTHLRGERRAVALELRGHGGSDPPADGDHSVGGYRADVAACADALLPHTLVRGTGHWLQLDRPAELNAWLDAFLTQL